eukprot:jgi/Tetstr1/446061/TSEL_033663.t1
MNRRWRHATTKQHLPSLPSYGQFVAGLPPLAGGGAGAGLARPADVYSALCALHAKGQAPSVVASSCGGFHYLLANTDYVNASGSEAREMAVPPHFLLALVDSDGTVTTQRLFRHIQAPEEGRSGAPDADAPLPAPAEPD